MPRWTGALLVLLVACDESGGGTTTSTASGSGSGSGSAKKTGFGADLAKELGSGKGNDATAGSATAKPVDVKPADSGSGSAKPTEVAAGSGSGSAKPTEVAAGSGSGSAKPTEVAAGSGSGSAKPTEVAAGSGSAKPTAGSGSAKLTEVAAGSGSATKPTAGSGSAKPTEVVAAGSGSAKPTPGSGTGSSGSAVAMTNAGGSGSAAKIPAPPDAPARVPVKVPADLAAIKLSLLPNWERDIGEAGTISLAVKVQGKTDPKIFVFRYGYEVATAPNDRDQYLQWLGEQKILSVTTNRQRGSAWMLEGTDGSGSPSFRFLVNFGGRKLICGGLLYKDAASSQLGDLRDQTIIQAKQICETLAL